MHLLISVFSFDVKLGGGRPGSQQEGPCRGGWEAGAVPHFFVPLAAVPSAEVVATARAGGSLASPALSLRIEGPSSSSR